MVNAILIAARNAALSKNVARPTVPPGFVPFPDSHWQTCAAQREALDVFASASRWRISITPLDGVPREYFMVGSHSEVAARARIVFPSPQSIVIEPAVSKGGEHIDRRFYDIPQLSRTRS